MTSTTDVIITILGTAILALTGYIFTSLRSEFREFKQDVKDQLSEFREDLKDNNENLMGIIKGFDDRLSNIEKKKRK
jgi:gas vesicle protein